MGFPTIFIARGAPPLVSNNVIISANTQNANIFTLAGSPSDPVTLVVQINAGIVVDSASFLSSLIIQNFHPLSTFRLNVLAGALILGSGGLGGRGSRCNPFTPDAICNNPFSTAGAPGGIAVMCQGDITIDNLGEIRGGGGGGGGGGCGANQSVSDEGGGGGGGVGSVGGAGGANGESGTGGAGDSTRPIGNPGLGGVTSGGDGGDGGDWGAPGAAGVPGTSPGGAGACASPGSPGGIGGPAVSIVSGTTTFITMGTISGNVS